MFPRCFVFCVLLLAPLPIPGNAAPNVSRFGRNLVLAADQSFSNVTCVLCSAVIDGHGSGSVRVFAGNVFLDGTVGGKVLVFGGNVTLTSKARVGQRVMVFGGHFYQNAPAPGAPRTVLPPIIFLPLILLVSLITAWLVVLTRRMVRGPVVYPPLPRL